MEHRYLEPCPDPATPTDLGNVFRVTALWLQEHGTVDPSSRVYLGETAPSIEINGEIINELFPDVLLALKISPKSTVDCTFYPAYLQEGHENIILIPSQCVFDIPQDDQLVESVRFEVSPDDSSNDEWLGIGEKHTDYRYALPISSPEKIPSIIRAIMFGRRVQPGTISAEECAALQMIADNFNLLKDTQDNRNA